MSRAPRIRNTGCALLFAHLAAHFATANAATDAQIEQNNTAQPTTPLTSLQDDGSEDYRQEIIRLESAGGAYAGQLPEHLLGLGLRLQESGEHQAAIDAFKRGIHLTRINDGLHSEQQIPMLQREIASHIALGQYVEADTRQQYLYRIQMQSMEGGMTRARALMQQARWQLNTYHLALDGRGFARLMSMWDLYRRALNDIVDRQGETSSLLLEPLQGMLLAQYLITDYDVEKIKARLSNENFAMQQQLNRFNAYRAQSYKKGRAVIQAIYDIEHANSGGSSPQTANSRILLGDWLLWHGQRSSAMDSYQQAIAELVELGDAQEDIDARFAEPVALPNVEGARRLPATVAVEQANLLVKFDVSKAGKVRNIERQDNSELAAGRANKVMRTLRNTRFRPRLAMGEPQETRGISRAYEIEQPE